jgi:hypothetical protein
MADRQTLQTLQKGSPAYQQQLADIRADRKDIFADRKDLRSDRQDITADRHDISQDRKGFFAGLMNMFH